MPASDPTAPRADLLRVRDLEVAFSLQGQVHEVLRGINFRVPHGKVVALVGESGSGKSVTTQAALGLLPANGMITGGGIEFNDPRTGGTSNLADIARNGKAMQAIRGARISMIVGLASASLAIVVSLIIGIPSGYFGGKLDMIVQRFVDAWMFFPNLPPPLKADGL